MKKILKVFVLAVSLVTALATTSTDSFASFVNYTVIDHPDKQVANLLPWGLVLGRTGDDYVDYFHMADVDMVLNQSTGTMVYTGTIIHTQRASHIGGSIIATPNQAWSMQAVFNNVRYEPGFGFTPTPFRNGPIPREGMLDELKTIGEAWGPGRDFLVWDKSSLSINPLVANPLYTRARSLVGKPNENADRNLLGYRLDLETGPWINDPKYNLLTQNAWWEIPGVDMDDREYTRGDFHIALQKQGGPVIPEPGTMALLGVGLSGMGILRSRKKL